jgi:hypothetical protein
VDILVVRHGSWQFPAVAPTLGEGFQDRVPQQPGGGRSPWVLKVVPRRWEGTIPLVVRVAKGAAAGLTGGWRSGVPRVRISIGNPRGQRTTFYCQTQSNLKNMVRTLELDLGDTIWTQVTWSKL